MSISEYQVEVSESAEEDVDRIYLWIQERSIGNAMKWYHSYLRALDSLASFPYRCPMLRDDPCVRKLLFGNYHLIYKIVEPTAPTEAPMVRVIRVLHASRETMDEDKA